MEFSAAQFLLILVKCVFHASITKANVICGNTSSDSCHQACHDGCMTRAGNEDLTVETVKESIATQTNLCVNKCFGSAFIPLLSEDIPKLPKYSNALDCLGRCAYPAHTKYCLQGFLSSFFYCDCHQCCLQNQSGDSKKCVRGCHNWFLRQWSPKPAQGCRYRPEYMNSPRTYCTDFCTHAVLERNASLSWDDIPSIVNTTAASCISKCVSLMASKVPIGYDMALISCTDLTKCITVAVFEFNVILNYTLDKTSLMARSEEAYIEGLSESNKMPNYVREIARDKYRSAANRFLTIPAPGLYEMHKSGVNVFSEKDAEHHTHLPLNYTPLFPWRDVGHILATAYNNTSSNEIFEGSTVVIIYRKEFYIEPCTHMESNATMKYVENIIVYHEVYFKISDTKGLFPLTATELRHAMSMKSEWSDLEFVRNHDDYTIVMKGRGILKAAYVFDLEKNSNCEAIPGCNYPLKTPGVTERCRVNDTSEIHLGGFP